MRLLLVRRLASAWRRVHADNAWNVRIVFRTDDGFVSASVAQVMQMEWPLGAAVADAVIVRQDLSAGSRFAVRVGCVAELTWPTYAEAEAHAASYAEGAGANVWYVERGRLQLVCSFINCQLRKEAPVEGVALLSEAAGGDRPPGR